MKPALGSPLLAEFYEGIFGGFSESLAPIRRRLLREIRPRPARILDLASGPGDAAADFAKLGARVIAIDLNSSFVRRVVARARREGLSIDARRGDMRRFRLPRPVDLVTCNFDALNHLPRRSDLRPTLASIRRALVPEGHFFFDVNRPRALSEVWPRWSGLLEKPGYIVIAKRGYDPRRKRAVFHLTWFLKERERDRYRRIVEVHREVAWPRRELEGLLASAGFEIRWRKDIADLLPKEVRGRRDFYLVRRVR